MGLNLPGQIGGGGANFLLTHFEIEILWLPSKFTTKVQLSYQFENNINNINALSLHIVNFLYNIAANMDGNHNLA